MTVKGWKASEKALVKYNTERGIFLVLKNDKDKVVGSIVGEPVVTLKHYLNNGKEIVVCSDDENCLLCEDGDKPQFKFSVNFFQLGGVNKMKIWEGSKPTFVTLNKIVAKMGQNEWAFEIEREGAAGSKQTKYSVVPDHKMTPEEATLCAVAKQLDLEKTDIADVPDVPDTTQQKKATKSK